jgi:hypothetical protein
MQDRAKSFVDAITKEVENDLSVPVVFGTFRTLPGQIRKQIEAWQKENTGMEIPDEVKWELTALDIMAVPRRRRGDSPDKPFRPMAEFVNAPPYPDVDALLCDKEAIGYYRGRSQETGNPVRKARYADLVWVALREHHEPSAYQYAIDAAEAYVAQAPLCLEQERYSALVDCLDRASEISVQLNNQKLASRVVETAIALLSQMPEQHSCRSVLDIGDSFLYILDKFPASMSHDNLMQLRQVAQAGITEYASTKPRNLHLVRDLTELVSAVSELLQEPTEAWSYRAQVPELFEAEARERESATGPTGGGLVAYKLMEAALNEYQRLRSIAPNEEEKQRLQVKIREAKAEVRRLMRLAQSQMEAIEVEFEMPTEDLERMVRALLEVGSDQVFRLLSYYPDMVPDIHELRQKADQAAHEFIFSSLMGMTTLRNGRKVDETPPMSGGETQLGTFLSTWFQVHFVVLDYIFKRLKEEALFSSESFIAHMRTWEFLDESDVPFIETGLERYFAEDYASALHLLTTRIEHMLKSAFEQVGVPVIVVADQRRIREQTLGDFLNRGEVRTALGEDLWFYTCYVLVDESGLNLRNDVAHGWIQFHSCNRLTVQIILFLILLLTRLHREHEEDEKKHIPSDSQKT